MDFLVSDGFRTAIHIVGRVLFCMLFIIGGLRHFLKMDDVSASAASKGVPAAKAWTALSGIAFLVGGVLVLLGWSRFIGAGLLAIFLVLAAVLMHPFWKETDPGARMSEMVHFMKDMALAGAALLIAYYSGTAWPLALG
jgi:putative oxidoreductase